MNVLFLDDNPARWRWAEKNLGAGNTLRLAENAAEAVAWLGATDAAGFADPPFDIVYLDHDLGDDVYQNSADENCGMEVVRWVEEHKPKVGRFVVHSMNHPAACEMMQRLVDAGYAVDYCPFMALAQRGAR